MKRHSVVVLGQDEKAGLGVPFKRDEVVADSAQSVQDVVGGAIPEANPDDLGRSTAGGSVTD